MYTMNMTTDTTTPPADIMQVPTALESAPTTYTDATPVVAKTRSSFWRNVKVIGFVIIVVILVLVVVLFSDLPKFTNRPTSFPAANTSGPVSNNVIDPNAVRFQLGELKYAYIKADGSIAVIDPQDKEVVIKLESKNWQNLQLSPTGKYVSVLSTEKDKQNYNINLFDVTTGKWQQITQYADQGVDNYVWKDAEQILFTQDGWLHEYDHVQHSLLKLTDLKSKLVYANIEFGQLIFSKFQDREVAPAVMKQIPDPNWPKGKLNPPLVEVEDKPAIIKTDQIFTVTNLTGKNAQEHKIETVETFSGDFVLTDMRFTELKDQYIYIARKYDRTNGKTAAYNDTIYLSTAGVAERVETEDRQFALLGSLFGRILLLELGEQGEYLSVLEIRDNKLLTNTLNFDFFIDAKPVHAKINRVDQNQYLLAFANERLVNAVITKNKSYYYLDNELELTELAQFASAPEVQQFKSVAEN